MSARLRPLQHWMQAAITDRRGIDAIGTREIEREIAPSATLDARRRIGIYADMVALRLVECLGEDFPAVRRAVGERRFEELARDYLDAHPSTHFSLNQLGAAFPRFLAGARVQRKAFVVELAELERAIQEVFDAPAVEPLTPRALEELPRDRWPSLRLRPTPAMRLFAFRHPVNDYYLAFREGREPGAPSRRATHVLVYRKQHVVWRADLSRERHALLDALSAGVTLSEALERCAARPGADVPSLARSAAAWLGEWCDDGLFVEVLSRNARRIVDVAGRPSAGSSPAAEKSRPTPQPRRANPVARFPCGRAPRSAPRPTDRDVERTRVEVDRADRATRQRPDPR